MDDEQPTDPPPAADPVEPRADAVTIDAAPTEPTRIARYRQRAVELGDLAVTTVEDRRRKQPVVDLAVNYYERDREAIASVLGAAIALRLYLFIIPVVISLVGLAIALVGKDNVDQILDSANITGTLAKDISSATSSSRSAGLVLAIVGLWLTLWAGRSLTKVLAAGSGRAWRLEAKASRATYAATGAITATVVGMFACTLILNRLRDRHGLAASTTSWLLTGVLFAVTWFVVTWALPRGTRDPGALLPGAGFMAVTLTALQWFMQFYLPEKVSRYSDLAGQMGTSMAALGYLFLMGRLIAMTFVIDAVVFEQVGSLSRLLFSVPVVRAIPRRYPVVADFFDLHPEAPPDRPAEPALLVDPDAEPSGLVRRKLWRRSEAERDQTSS